MARAGAAAADRADNRRAQAAMRISLGHYHFLIQDLASSVEHFTRAVDFGRQADWPQVQASALGNLAATYGMRGDLDLAVDSLTAALALNRQIGSRRGEMANLSNLGLTELRRGQLVEAESHLRQSIALCREDGHPTLEIHALSHLCEVLILMDRLEDAGEQVEVLGRLCGDVGHVDLRIMLLSQQTRLYSGTGDAAAALASATEAIETTRPTGDRLLTVTALQALGTASALLGRHDDAVAHHRQALTLAEEIEHRYSIGEALIALARSALPVDRAAAVDAARAGPDHARGCGFRVHEAQALAVLAAVEHAGGDVAAAAALAGKALALQEETGWRQQRATLERFAERG